MLEDICDGSQTHPKVNNRESCYKISDRIKQRKPEWKGALKYTRNVAKVLHKVFKTVVKEISQDLNLGESGSEISHLITEPRNFSEVTKLSDDINKPWLKATQFSISACQDFHQIEFLPCTHPCMELQVDLSLDI